MRKNCTPDLLAWVFGFLWKQLVILQINEGLLETRGIVDVTIKHFLNICLNRWNDFDKMDIFTPGNWKV